MVRERKTLTAQENIHIGMAFFLLGIFVSMVAEGRMIGALLSNWVPDQSFVDAIQGFTAGFSIPISCVSIFFNLRGLLMLRSR